MYSTSLNWHASNPATSYRRSQLPRSVLLRPTCPVYSALSRSLNTCSKCPAALCPRGRLLVSLTGSPTASPRSPQRPAVSAMRRNFGRDWPVNYLFSALPVGAYRLTVEKEGFSTYVQEGITLDVSQAVTQPVILHPGAVNQQINVSADAQMLPTQSSTVSGVVREQPIMELPLNGRETQGLV